MKENLDKEEKKIVESFEKGEWKSVSNVEEEINSFVKVAKESLRKDKEYY